MEQRIDRGGSGDNGGATVLITVIRPKLTTNLHTRAKGRRISSPFRFLFCSPSVSRRGSFCFRDCRVG